MPNRLSKENSPYLLQHKDNPVDWYPWGQEALDKAKKENKPIFLSIGYAACHWCHVMEHESFENPATANLMNEKFVNIKVDREERPDLDAIYMSAVVSMTGQGGWPMSVFLTPEGEPFYGGTYYPPTSRYGMPAFSEVLNKIKDAWEKDEQKIRKSGKDFTEHLNKTVELDLPATPLNLESTKIAALKLAQTYDWHNGGWGKAPKFPQPMAIQFLLKCASQGDKMSLDVATHALKEMAKGGMYDVVGGGFARYSVDNNWLVPHFEKMLYDNAQLARSYLHAYLITKEPFFRQICEEILDFIVREMTHEKGGFYSSIDADSEGEEGKFYVWSYDELENIIEDSSEFKLLIDAYGISREGNFEGKNILQRALSNDELAKKFKFSVEDILKKLTELHKILYKVRSQRVWPNIDDKVLVSWNALMLITFSEASRYLRRHDYLKVAQRNAEFLLKELRPQDRLLRSWRDDKASHNAYLEDHAGLALGLLALYQSDHNNRWFAEAVRLAEDMVTNFTDPNGGFFDTHDDHEQLIFRPKDLQDNATPSGNALAATALFELAAFTGNSDWYDLAAGIAGAQQKNAQEHPTSFSQWLCAISFGTSQIQEVAILGDPADTDTVSLVNTIWQDFKPHSIVAVSAYPPVKGSPPLLDNRPLIDGKPTAYVCRNFICKLPVNSPIELAKLLQISE